MDELVSMVLDSAEDAMKHSIEHLIRELAKIRAGKANPVMLQSVRAEYYGAPTPLNQLASVVATDARTLTITPFDKGSLHNIERAIIAANLGLNPQNDGTLIRIAVPMLTEERRKSLVKQAKNEGENAKISIRNIRRDHNDQMKKLKEDSVSEDQIKDGESEIQKLTNTYGSKVDEILKVKEGEIMTV